MRPQVYDSYDLFAKVADGRAQGGADTIDSTAHFVKVVATDIKVVDPATKKHRHTGHTKQPSPARSHVATPTP